MGVGAKGREPGVSTAPVASVVWQMTQLVVQPVYAIADPTSSRWQCHSNEYHPRHHLLLAHVRGHDCLVPVIKAGQAR